MLCRNELASLLYLIDKHERDSGAHILVVCADTHGKKTVDFTIKILAIRCQALHHKKYWSVLNFFSEDFLYRNLCILRVTVQSRALYGKVPSQSQSPDLLP